MGTAATGAGRGGRWANETDRMDTPLAYLSPARVASRALRFLCRSRARLRLSDALTLDGGVDNLLDRDYRPHLAGTNRVVSSDVAVGEPLPGAGRRLYMTM